jgi:hypothetical protein
MKLNFNSSPTFSSDDMISSKMGVIEGSADIIASFLRDKIYTNKYLACVRETITNAFDEHVKHNIDRDVEVTIKPKDDKYVWAVRDYALGLSEEHVRNIYGMYGGSTKRNNNTQIGGFGIGALSPFSVSDTFYIASHYAGEKTQYVCTLGAGDNGVPVGEIYKISTEPSSETGIEVSMEIDYTKRMSFVKETMKFVQQFLPSANISFVCEHMSMRPATPTLTMVEDEFTFNLYDSKDFGDYYSTGVAIRMGGVVYRPHHAFFDITGSKGKIVVDVPIGTLTIPISRENIEDTVNNTAVLNKIQSTITNFREKDRSNIKIPKFGSFFVDRIDYVSKYSTDWFEYPINEVFADSCYLNKMLGNIKSGLDKLKNANGQYMVYLIPDIKSYNNWNKRLELYLTQTHPSNSTRYIINTTSMQNQLVKQNATYDLSDVCFVNVKTMKLPKLPSSGKQTAFLVYKNSRKYGTFTADELEENVSNGVDIDPEWYKTAQDMDELYSRTVSLTPKYGTSCNWFVTNSKRLHAELLEIGWIDRDSSEFKDREKIIRDEYERERSFNTIQNNMNRMLFMTAPNQLAIRSMVKNAAKYDKFRAIRDKICAENTTRGRILRGLNHVYTPVINRSDLRTILNLNY